jgi:hypothetical protein
MKSEDGTFNFGARRFDRLAGLLRESASKFFLALRHGGNDLAQNTLAFECREATGRSESFDSRGNCGFRMFFTALHHAGDQIVIVGCANLDEVALLMPPAIHKKTVRRNGRDRHLGHDFFGAPIDPTLGIIGLWMQHELQSVRKHLHYKHLRHRGTQGDTLLPLQWLANL